VSCFSFLSFFFNVALSGNHPYEDVKKDSDHPYKDLAKSGY
jgi:hypothetical protein